jgi:hypothetical protein
MKHALFAPLTATAVFPCDVAALMAYSNHMRQTKQTATTDIDGKNVRDARMRSKVPNRLEIHTSATNSKKNTRDVRTHLVEMSLGTEYRDLSIKTTHFVIRF